jgi:hypothetical protein
MARLRTSAQGLQGRVSSKIIVILLLPYFDPSLLHKNTVANHVKKKDFQYLFAFPF